MTADVPLPGLDHIRPPAEQAHVLVVTDTGNPDQPHHYTVPCPNRALGVRASCAAWTGCGCPLDFARYDSGDDTCPTSQTGRHELLDGEALMMPTAECWVGSHEQLSDAARELEPLDQGAYVVRWSEEDMGRLTLWLPDMEPTRQ